MVREVAWRVAPGTMAERAARFERSVRERWGLPAAADRFIADHGDRVLHGPFEDLRYWRGGDAPIAKLLGVYEREITPALSRALATLPPVFVDLGAADGYYAVGVKRVNPSTKVIAFELAPTARRELRRLAELNAVEITIRRRASARAVQRLPLDRALVLCDIEGAEVDVLDSRTVARLTTATVIVELHEHARPGVTDVLHGRFDATHEVDIRRGTRRSPDDYPELASLSEADAAEALSEGRGRGPMAWAVFTPR